MTKGKHKRVAVGISGGVDSSVAAAILKDNGFTVIGVHMVCFDEDVPYCTATEDKEYAIRVAARLDIPLKIYNFQQEYQERVIDHMVAEYTENRTPNPDIVCNREIKFGLLFEKVVQQLGVDYLATGHYARVGSQEHKSTGALEHFLMKGADPSKDQSYFLYSLTSKHLGKVLFPIGGMMKEEVRKYAHEHSLPTAARADSQGLCFVGQVDVAEFLAERINCVPGEVVTSDGLVVGVHQGLPFYTIGQRHGFELESYFEEPQYVIGKIKEKNQLVVGEKPELKVKQFEVLIDNWVGKGYEIRRPRDQEVKCGVRIRHLGKIVPSTLEISRRKAADINQSSVIGFEPSLVTLRKTLEAVAPGQLAVFYDRERVLGGGVIQ